MMTLPSTSLLTPEEGALLLQCSRQQLIVATSQNQEAPFLPNLAEIPPRLKEKRALFVTLYRSKKTSPLRATPVAHRELRGCIGNIFPVSSLYQDLLSNTTAAALHDPRFVPVCRQEVDQLQIELNILTLPELTSLEEIELGRDGIILSFLGGESADSQQGRIPSILQRAVFLPKVPIEQGWDLTETLNQLSQKAGLLPHSWQNMPIQLERFQSQIFTEEG